MKHLKILGLVTAVAVALACIGAGTASAAKLCKTVPNKSGVCEGGNYLSNTAFSATSTSAVLTVVGSGVVATVSCSHSVVSLKSTAESGSPAVPGEVRDLTFTGCITNGGSSCTISTSSGYGSDLTPTTDTGNGTLKVTGSAETEVVCSTFFKCKYKVPAGGVFLGFTGGNPAAVSSTNQALTLVAGFGYSCGTGANWDASYALVGPGPTALWVSTS